MVLRRGGQACCRAVKGKGHCVGPDYGPDCGPESSVISYLDLQALQDLAKGLQEDKWVCDKAGWQDDSHPSNPSEEVSVARMR